MFLMSWFLLDLSLLACTLFNAHALYKWCCVPGRKHIHNNYYAPNSKVCLITRDYGMYKLGALFLWWQYWLCVVSLLSIASPHRRNLISMWEFCQHSYLGTDHGLYYYCVNHDLSSFCTVPTIPVCILITHKLLVPLDASQRWWVEGY